MTEKKKPSPKVLAAIDAVIEQFKTGDLSPIIKRTLLIMPAELPAANWTYANAVLAYMTTKYNSDCRGFKQWQEVGRKVKKGSRAGYIFKPKTLKHPEETDKDGNPLVIVTGFQPIPVFGYDATEGDDLPAEQMPTVSAPPNLAEVAEKLGVSIRYDWFPDQDALGQYFQNRKEIHLYTDQEDVWWHELAHAAHHKIDDEFDSRSSQEQEIVAEFTAAVIGQMYGRPTTGNAYKYIEMLSPNDPIKGVMKSLATIEKVLAVMEL